jgi:hypothetical protein
MAEAHARAFIKLDRFAPMQVTREYRLSTAQHSLLLHLILLVDWRDANFAWSGTLVEMVEDIPMSRTTAAKALQALEEHGLVYIIEPFRGGGATGTVSIPAYYDMFVHPERRQQHESAIRVVDIRQRVDAALIAVARRIKGNDADVAPERDSGVPGERTPSAQVCADTSRLPAGSFSREVVRQRGSEGAPHADLLGEEQRSFGAMVALTERVDDYDRDGGDEVVPPDPGFDPGPPPWEIT